MNHLNLLSRLCNFSGLELSKVIDIFELEIFKGVIMGRMEVILGQLIITRCGEGAILGTIARTTIPQCIDIGIASRWAKRLCHFIFLVLKRWFQRGAPHSHMLTVSSITSCHMPAINLIEALVHHWQCLLIARRV